MAFTCESCGKEIKKGQLVDATFMSMDHDPERQWGIDTNFLHGVELVHCDCDEQETE